ncbi:MAG: hypothetical protein SCAL_000674 [Candidatus Syntrophoarchaeum caldarius]|uniref:Uncharacterized protein n=1 Tax=Candidatus Syntropharchaeum caldarium TaxID=1838285 RepID=A0A1F2PAF6_9EURY|nr:MAG: hypothetical protein SCAL_000674 [Candidatus Syntrophoarchaeum caldarius]
MEEVILSTSHLTLFWLLAGKFIHTTVLTELQIFEFIYVGDLPAAFSTIHICSHIFFHIRTSSILSRID